MEAAQLLIQKGLIKLEDQPNEGVKKKGRVYVTRVRHDKKKEEASELTENTKDDTMQEETDEQQQKQKEEEVLDDWEDDDTTEVITKASDKKQNTDEINVHDTSKEEAKIKESRKVQKEQHKK